jgi:hypothetical protein
MPVGGLQAAAARLPNLLLPLAIKHRKQPKLRIAYGL